MGEKQQNDIVYPLFEWQFDGLVHGSVSSHGGCSCHPYSSNNISFGVGDDMENVEKNRRLIKRRFGIPCLASAVQVHGDAVYHINEAIKGDVRVDGYDALITDQKGVGLMIGHADCQAIILYAPTKKVIAAVHCGWRGSVRNIAAKVVMEMKERYGCSSAELHAAVSPSLGPCCAEFVNYEKELPKSFWKYSSKQNYFDFWKITRQQLAEQGLSPDRINVSGICTSCSTDFFSYRRACRDSDGVTGRNGTLIAMV